MRYNRRIRPRKGLPMSADHTAHTRPYWHLDAKWIAGLLLAFVLGLTLLVYNLVQITAEKPAVDALSTAMALAFSRNGLDDETEIAEVRQRLRASPGGTFQPIPGLRVVVQERDIADLSPREARLYFFRQLAEPLYRGGPEELAALADDPAMRQQMAQGVGPLGLLTRQTHETLQGVLRFLGIASVVLAALLVLFSYRFGRLASPGCVLFVASLPGAALFTFLARGLGSSGAATAPPTGQDAGMTGMIGYLAAGVLPPLLRIMSRNYLVAMALGLGLVAIAFLVQFVWWLTHRGRGKGRPSPWGEKGQRGRGEAPVSPLPRFPSSPPILGEGGRGEPGARPRAPSGPEG
ncbi:MAG: hypothetical protein HYY04_08180 [Chloroflexi bacterium]|nr:hypothetical protein [Chloroflexota bacterium]